MRRIFLLLFFLLTLVVSLQFIRFNRKQIFLSREVFSGRPLYQATGKIPLQISILSDVSQVSTLEITPDGQYMLVGTLPGTVWIYHKVDGEFRRQQRPFFTLQTAQPGWPPQEAGLTGIILGEDFERSGDVFFAFSYAFEKKNFRNRITRVKFIKLFGQVIGILPKQIFEANTPGTGSHQIQDGVGVTVGGVSSILFTVGEGFVSERALDPLQEAGKVILITRDGTSVPGDRPFDQLSTVQALGIRNAPAMAVNPTNGKVVILDTGPSNFDRFLYGILYKTDGTNSEPISFHWDGTENSLQKDALDLYDESKNMALYRWAPTETPVNVVFYENDKLSSLGELQNYVLVTLFGRTGEKGNEIGKKILLGTIGHGKQNVISFIPIIERSMESSDVLGHPLGLAVDPSTKDIYFGDIIEKRIYKVVVQ